MSLERVLRWALVSIAIVGLAAGILAYVANRPGLADLCWTLATASTPNRPARKSRTIETARPATTGAVANVQHRSARPGRPATYARIPTASPTIAIETSAHRRTRSNDINRIPVHGGHATPDRKSGRHA